MAVWAPRHEFLHKYFEQEFQRDIVTDPVNATDRKTCFLILDSKDGENEDVRTFRDKCQTHGCRLITLRLPAVVGTGMGDPVMKLAKNIARGTMFKIKENNPVWSVIHATDVARLARVIMERDLNKDVDIVVPGTQIQLHDLIDALAYRMGDKKIGTLKYKFARLFFRPALLNIMTQNKVVENPDFTTIAAEFKFTDPADYLKTHVYDENSL